MTTYLERLAARSSAVGSVLCLGLDPDPAALPVGFPATIVGIERFCRLILEAAGPYAAAVKPNLAFFEAFGSAGMAALERIRAALPAGLPVVIDAKRGDIGSTAERQATAIFDGLAADAVTASPYVGAEGLAPFLDRADRYVYILCRTSNPGSDEVQGLPVAAGPDAPAEPLHERVARLVTTWGPGGTAGLVVGATAPAELARIRRIAPGLGFLVPGVGTQGGQVAPVLAGGPATAAPAGGRPGGGLLVNVSRAIARAALDGSAGSTDPGQRVAAAAQNWSTTLTAPVLFSVSDPIPKGR
ncbi:MAG: orotidine-5'-phosphate decarboxylase [Candidatus Limnocylindrales bacterium]